MDMWGEVTWGIHAGFGFCSRNCDVTTVLEFACGLCLVICNSYCKKVDSKLLTYVLGPVKSKADQELSQMAGKKCEGFTR